MSLIRRRMLLAASQTGGGGFYADFHFDYCEESWGVLSCYRAADELGVACYNEVVRLIEKYGTQIDAYNTELNNPINYGFEVYVEGSIVTRLSSEYGTYYLTTNGEYMFTNITRTGRLSYEY